ncbi:MAG: MFS transporter [Methylophaga sp.]|nr:MFS transporter [Methylophaga sp.]
MPIFQMQFLLLMVSVFTISIGYGIALPILPFLLENRFGGSAGFSVAFHTGMLTGIFMFMLFICAPIWGRLSDNIGRRPVIIIGLGGSILALLLFGFAQQLWFAYLMRALGGALASAVLPVSLAYISDSCFKERRARRFAWMSASATFGILIGPVIGGWLSSLDFWTNKTGFDANSLPFVIAGLFGLMVWGLLIIKLDEPNNIKPNSSSVIDKHNKKDNNPSNILLILALLGMFALGSFEVGIALQGQQTLLLSPFQIGILYMVCSVMMIIVQVFLFSALVRRFTFIQIISGALLLMALGLIIFPVVSRFEIVLLAVALIGLSSGVLVPILAFEASLSSEISHGKILGKQTAAGSLGQALGSVFAGVLFSIFTQAPFWFAASLLISGIFLGMRLRRIQPELN